MKTDARVRYTKMRIKEAFCTLLEQKPMKRITVRELCELAEINRATFYKHYADVFDLIEQLENEALEHLRENIRRDGGHRGLLKGVLRNAKEPHQKIALLCGPHGDPNFSAHISEVIYQGYLPMMGEALPDCSEEERQAAYRFIAGGSGSIITDWINNGMETPPEVMTEQLLSVCERFIGAYQTTKEPK